MPLVREWDKYVGGSYLWEAVANLSAPWLRGLFYRLADRFRLWLDSIRGEKLAF